jgi:NADH-quinone oxidoreductase subunit L
VGDFGFALGILLIFLHFPSHAIDFETVFREAPAFAQAHPDLMTLIALCLFAGAVGKSAQLPLYVWLPDAMEGPSPVSALIHAATMVTAGVYMTVRCGPLFSQSATALTVVAAIGGLTALFAALIALTQTDIKRILAYSTISQLGYMFLAVGVGAAGAAIFHLYTHAFFKALLFLAAGAIMHALHEHIDLRELSGLKKDLPWTRWTFLIGAAALAGVPLLSGFFSKDQILVAALSHERLAWLGWLGVLTAGLTAFYTFRCYFLAFHGPRQVPAEVAHPHETPVMTFSLVVLAVGAALAGHVNLGEHGFLGEFLHRSASVAAYARLEGAQGPSHLQVMALSTAAVAFGIGLAALLYLFDRRRAERLAAALGPLYRLSRNKFYVDELYDRLFVGPLRGLGRLCFGHDNWVIDSLLWLVALAPQALGAAARLTQRGFLNAYALYTLAALAVILFLLLRGS